MFTLPLRSVRAVFVIGGADCAAIPVMYGVYIGRRLYSLIAIALLEVGSSWLGIWRGGLGNWLEWDPSCRGEVVEVT